ncbi:MAG: trigger factor [Ndongobacter sp.]|nr:trigger factor [Ndongobacter sp.]
MTAVLISHENDKAVYTTEVSQEVFEQAITRVYQRTKGRYQIPGFRKGHAPRKLIEANYGVGVFYDDALNEVLPGAIEAATKELGLEPIGQPSVDLKDFEAGKTIVFEVTTETQPHPTLGDYKAIEVAKRETSVSDEQVDEVIRREQEKNGVQREVSDRPAGDGDEVTIDFEGSVDGVPFEGGKAEGHKLVLGSNSFIPGFEKQVEGHSVGEEFDIDVTFPENYGAQELAGKAAVFHIVLHGISERELPELDDDFAQDVSEFDTMDEYRQSVKENLEKEAGERNRAQCENDAIEKLIEISDVHVPQAMIDEQVEQQIRDLANQVQQMGLGLDKYLEYTNQTIDQLREQHAPMAERRVAGDLVLTSLVEAECIEASDEEIEAEIRRLGERYGAKDVEDFVKRVKEAGNDALVAQDVKKKKAIDRLMECVRFVEPKAEAEEATDAEAKEV